ncbi:MAG TPA: ATP-binding cassette domain-containing protein [Bacilli bacterium]
MYITVEHLAVYDETRSRPILADISCRIEAGGITLILGKNGAGKSTFLNVLSGLHDRFTGTIAYNGEPVWRGKKEDARLRRRIGHVFQYPEQQLFARTVAGEFAYSLRFLRLPKQEREQKAAQALEACKLPPELSGAFPFELSGGQKRRVALASTFCTGPDWLFLDEPTAGLDSVGMQYLLSELIARKNNGCGIVMATHDLDAFLPIADRAIVLNEGRVTAQLSARDLSERPDILADAGIGVPESLALAAALRSAGIAVPGGFVSPHEAAQAIERSIKRKQTFSIQSGHVAAAKPIGQSPGASPGFPADSATGNGAENFDPRAKWLAYMLLSIGVFAERQWAGLACAAMVTWAVIWACRVPLRQYWPLAKPYLAVMLIGAIFSGVGFGGSAGIHVAGSVTFSLSSALTTLFSLSQIFLVMLLGMAFMFTTSQLKMKAGLEQSLAFLRRLKLPVEAFSLTASLLLRFIPMIARERERFSRIVQARGKRQSKRGAVGLRDIATLATPLIISVIHLAADLAQAMEARGCGRAGLFRVQTNMLRMNRYDACLILLSCATLALLIGMRFWLFL